MGRLRLQMHDVPDTTPRDAHRHAHELGDDLLAVLEHSPDIIMLLERDGTIRYTNRVVPGLRIEDVIGSSSYDFVPEPARSLYRQRIAHVFDSGDSVSYEMPGVGPDGSESWYFSSMAPVVRDGEVVAVTIVTRDITERRALEAALQRAYEHERAAAEQLRDLDRIKRDFTAKVVHDLRTPVTIVDGFATTLTAGWETFDDSQRRTYVEQIAAATARLTSLVQDVLDVTRLEAADYAYSVQPTDAGAAIHRVVDSLGPVGERVDVRIEADTPPMLVDPIRHEQVLDNLLANAMKFSPEDSPIHVRAHADADGGFVVVEVRDEGIGIPAEEAERVFERFAQLDPPDRGTPTGSGLGLHICRTIVEAQGGTIEVDSTRGSGSTFRYRLPVAPARAE